MTVRLSSLQIHQTGLTGMLDIQKSVIKTQEQIASGRRVLTPADDPVASTRILRLNEELQLNELYSSNIKTLRNRLEREEVALNGIGELVQRAQELVIQSGNGALNAEQRGYIAVELTTIIDSMVQRMNSRDATGEYIFGGFQGGKAPFVAGADGRYAYQGDEGQRSIQIASTISVASNDAGRNIFVNVESAVFTIEASANSRNRGNPPANIGSELILDREQFNAFYPENIIIEFRPLDEVSPPLLTYDIKQASDGRILAKNNHYVSGTLIEFAGVAVSITGEPVVGDTFLVESTSKKSLITNLEDFIATLFDSDDSGESQIHVSEEVQFTLENLHNAQTSLLSVQSSVGARLNLVESTRTNNADFELVVRKALSELADLDFAEAISRLTQESFILEAAQASFARISRLSLFNYF